MSFMCLLSCAVLVVSTILNIDITGLPGFASFLTGARKERVRGSRGETEAWVIGQPGMDLGLKLLV